MLIIQQLTDCGKNPNDGSKNYKLFIQSAPEQGSVSDPARQIGGWVSYNVRYQMVA